MKDLSPDDRPREKLLRHGAAALGDNELVALVLGSGSRRTRRARRRQRAAARARRAARPGAIGVRRSGAGRRHRRGEGGASSWPRSSSAAGRWRIAPAARVQLRDAARCGRATCCRRSGRAPVEHFGVVLLDTKHRVLRTTVVAVGTLNTTIVRAARRVPRGDARRGSGGRRVPQSSVRRSQPEPRRRRADAAAGGGRRR